MSTPSRVRAVLVGDHRSTSSCAASRPDALGASTDRPASRSQAVVPCCSGIRRRLILRPHIQRPGGIDRSDPNHVGVGPEAAGRATEQILSTVSVDHVVVCGIAGGVGPHREIGSMVVPDVVIDGTTRTEFRPDGLKGVPPLGSILTVGELVLDNEDLDRLAAEGIVAVDMESSAVGEVCSRLGYPWSVFRSISDNAGDGGVDESVLGLLREDGSVDVRAAIRLILMHPGRLRVWPDWPRTRRSLLAQLQRRPSAQSRAEPICQALAAWMDLQWTSMASAGSGLPKRNPCAMSHPISDMNSSCASVSIPSAVTVSPSV